MFAMLADDRPPCPDFLGGDHTIGTITKRARQDGKLAWGYTFFAGRTSVGKRIQITKSSFDTRKEARMRCARLSSSVDLMITVGITQRSTLSWAAKYLGDTELQSLAPLPIENILNNLLDSGGRKDETHPNGRLLSPRTVRHVAFLIHDSLQSAVRWGILPANPMDRVVLPKPEKKEIRALDKQGLSQLLGAVRGTSLFPLFVTAASTGAGVGNCLRWNGRTSIFRPE
jgi:hypothetical protein